MIGPAPKIPRSFTRRTTISVLAVFLLTMGLFLWTAFRSEQSLFRQESVRHLEETARALSVLPQFREEPTPARIAELEGQLAEATGVRHRLVVTDAAGRVVASAGGEDVEGWWVASAPLALADRRLMLMRPKTAAEAFPRRFWRIHGLHTAVTVVLFGALLWVLGERHVRRPIEQLAVHVRRVEAGEFETRPERYRADEFGWLADRFTDMGRRLKDTVERLVRSEKAATAGAVAYRVARESVEPLEALKLQIAYLEGLAGDDLELGKIVAALETHRRALVDSVMRLEELASPPEIGEGGSGEEADGEDRRRD